MMLALWYHTILATVFAMVAILLMLVILLQRGKGVGLSGAFGGAGGHTALGSKTGDILTWVTMVGAGLFILLAIALNFIFVPSVPILVPSSITSPTALPPGAPVDSTAVIPPAPQTNTLPAPAAGSPATGEKPSDKPAATPVEKSADKPAEKPAESPTKPPADNAGKPVSPAQTPPADKPEEKPPGGANR